jgi:Kef-type K+ transport system membrane component KefB
VNNLAFASSDIAPQLLGGPTLLAFLVQVALLLCGALLLGSLARHYHLPAVVGELTAGLLLGPSILGNIAPGLAQYVVPQHAEQFHLLDAVGLLGVLLLVGLSGIELNLGLMRQQSKAVARISVLAAILPFALGFGAGWLLPETFVPDGISRNIFAMFLGIALCVTAIPVIVKTLTDMRLLGHRIGQLTVSSAMIDDIVGWLLLSVISAVVVAGEVQAGDFARPIIVLVLFLAFMLTVGRYIVRWALATARRTGESGTTVMAMAVLIIGSAALTHALGLEAVFGAFVCGILIGTDPKFKRTELPLVNYLLAPLFFAIVGLRVDITALGTPVVLGVAILVIALAIIGKMAGAYLGARLSGLGNWESIAIGAAMNARGVVEIVIASVGLRLGVINTEMYTIIVLMAVVTSVMAPVILSYAVRRLPGSQQP